MKLLEQHDRRTKIGMSIYSEVLLDMISSNSGTAIMGLLEDAKAHKLACQATLIKSLQWLADNQFIKVERSDGDSRMKVCTVMQRGTIYLKNFQ